MKRWFLFGVGVLLLGGLGWYLLAPEVVTEEPTKTALRPVVLSQIELRDVTRGKLKLTLFAVEARLFEETEITELLDIRGIVEPETEGQTPTRFRADRGKIVGKEKLVSLIGDIQVTLPKDRTLLTQILFYDQNQDLLYNDQPVRLVGPGEAVDAVGMEYKVEQGFLTLKLPQVEVDL